VTFVALKEQVWRVPAPAAAVVTVADKILVTREFERDFTVVLGLQEAPHGGGGMIAARTSERRILIPRAPVAAVQ